MPPSAPAWIAAIAMLALSLFSPGVLNDGDSFSHVATGEWMIAHHAVPYADPFSTTRAGSPWVAHEWMAELAMAISFRLAGWTGVTMLTALAAATAFLQLGRHLARWLPAGPVALLLLLGCACFLPSLLARPHILALPFFEAWVAGLFIARDEGRAPSWWLLPVMCVWANLHGGFLLGLLLVLPLALEAVLAEPMAWRGAMRGWGLFLLGGTLAALLTPHGAMGLLFPLQLAGMDQLSSIGEWQPTSFATPQPLEFALLAGLYVALTRGFRLQPLRLLMLLGLLHVALQHTRHQMLVGLIVPLLLAAPIRAAMAPRPAPAPPRRWAAVGLALGAGLLAIRAAIPVTLVDGPTAPIGAVAHIPEGLAQQPVFNDYAFGGYLIFIGIHPFIDGRADMFGAAFLQQYAAITHPDRAAMESAFGAFGVRWTILSPGNPAVALLDVLPGWCRLYADGVAVIHARAC